MNFVIDRIEDGRIVVLQSKNGGEMFIPKSAFKFSVYEGMWLKVSFEPDKKSENAARARIKKLQQSLLKK